MAQLEHRPELGPYMVVTGRAKDIFGRETTVLDEDGYPSDFNDIWRNETSDRWSGQANIDRALHCLRKLEF